MASCQKLAFLNSCLLFFCTRFFQLVWLKTQSDSSTLFLSRGSAAIAPDRRFSLRHVESSGTYGLRIANLHETDAGIYQCRVELTPTSYITADVGVHVRGKYRCPWSSAQLKKRKACWVPVYTYVHFLSLIDFCSPFFCFPKGMKEGSCCTHISFVARKDFLCCLAYRRLETYPSKVKFWVAL